MQSNITILIEKPSELRCHVIFRENITKDLYVDLDELLQLRRFEFYPQTPMDVEKPSSVSTHQELLWRVPIHMDKKLYSSYIKNYEVRVDLSEIYIVHIQAHVPMHFRYQPSQYNQSFTNISVPNPEVFFDCDHKPIKKFSSQAKGASKLVELMNESNAPDFVPSFMVPNGRKEELPEIQMATLGLTMSFFIIISMTLISKSKQPIVPQNAQ
eukprot:403376451